MLSKKEIEKWSNEQRVKALAKFIVLRSFDPNKALLYGYMLDGLLDEINEKQRKIEQLETREQKLIEKLEEGLNECIKRIEEDERHDEWGYEHCKIQAINEILKILKGEKE